MSRPDFRHLLDSTPTEPRRGVAHARQEPATARKSFGRFSETVDRHSDDGLAALYAHHDRWTKRVFDLVVSFILLAILAPVMLAIAVAIRFTGRGPILFRHSRMGRDGLIFECLKFRTMQPEAEFRLHAILRADPTASAQWRSGRKLRTDPRVTPVGGILRRSGLDELPQLINILRGEMSLVGPRPATPEEVHHFGPDRKYYRLARPGMTGAWQVGRDEEGAITTRIRMDVDYVRHSSLRGDLKILAATPGAILTGRNR